MTPSPLQVVVDALERHGSRVKRSGADQVDATCPAHDDRTPSLSVRYDRAAGKVLVNCHTGCSPDDVIAALGLAWSDLFDPKPEQDRARRPVVVATYDYADEHGEVVFQKLRYFPKDFRVRRPDGRGWTWKIGDAPRVLYRLPELRAAVAAGKPVVVVEGEKDADRVAEQLGLAATCNYEGAAQDRQRPKWRREYTEQLRGAQVLIVADNDGPGITHAFAVAGALQGVAARVRVFKPAIDDPKADISDHLDAGRTLEDLVSLDEEPSTATADGVGDDAVLVPLSSVEPEELRWLWENRIPRGKIVTFDGDPSVGKSTLAVDVAARVSTGKPWPDGAPGELGDVLILSAEDGLADTIRPRLDAAGGDPARVHALTAVRSTAEDGTVTERPPTLADIPAIRAAILRTRAVLVVIDVLMAFLPGKVDSHKDQDIRAVLSRLTKVGEDTGAAFILLRHLNKAGGGSPMYRGGGSIGIVGAARAGYLIARDPDDPDTRVLACIKSNLAREPESLSYRLEPTLGSHVAHVVWTGASAHDAAGLLRSPLDGDEDTGSARTSAAEWLIGYFIVHGGAAKASDVMKAAKADDIAERTLRRARDQIGARVERQGFGKGAMWIYDPSDDTPSRPHSGHSGQPSEPGRNGRNGGRNEEETS